MTLFDFVKSQLSILDIVSEYVQLRPAGNYYKGTCPFHSETDASFTVSPDKQIFYCFGCHAGGDLISFVAKIENLTQIESVRHLIDRYNLNVPDSIKNGAFKDLDKTLNDKDLWFKIHELISQWANEKLLNSEDVLKYLSARFINLKEIKLFKIGYFPGGVRFINFFLKDMSKKGILLKDLMEGGFLQQGRSVVYSPFEERILFPIRDVLGRYVGFGGRIFKQNDERAKYYNSKDSLLFTKSKLLFGLNLAKKEMKKLEHGYLVEGYTDCIAMFKHGYLNTVATLGTACTVEHFKILARYINILFVIYDGDDAGQKAILRLTQLCWEVNLELKVIKLPEKEDPASYLNKNGKMDELIKNSQDIFSFFVEVLGHDFFNKPLAEKLKLSERIVDAILRLDSKFKQDLLLQKAASVMQISFGSLKNLMQEKKENKQKVAFLAQKKAQLEEGSMGVERQSESQGDKNRLVGFESVTLLEEKIFSAIINSVGKSDCFRVEDDLNPYFSEKIQFLLHKLEIFVKKCNSLNCFTAFIDNLDEPDRRWVLQVSLKFEQDVSRDFFEQLLMLFRRSHWKKIIQNIRLDIAKAKQQADKEKLQELFDRFSKLKKEIQDRGLI